MNTSQRTTAAIQARRQQTMIKLQQVTDAITRIRREKTLVTFAAVAHRAGVSRTFLYQNPDARALMTTEVVQTATRERQQQVDQDAQQDASWRERALNAEAAVRATHTEIRTQRTRIGELMGQIRDLEQEWTEDTIQRLTSLNTELKHRARQLAQDNRTLEDKLTAARSNNRFLDKQIAGLEAQLAELATAQH